MDYLRSRGRAVISKQNQLDFARHVCKGMVYLESQNFVHRWAILAGWLAGWLIGVGVKRIACFCVKVCHFFSGIVCTVRQKLLYTVVCGDLIR